MGQSPYLPTAYFNGKLIPFEQATISVATHGLQYGSGVFGGIRGYLTQDGGINLFRLDSHAKRFCRSAALLSIALPVDAAGLEQIILDLVRQNAPESDIYIRPFAYKAGLDLPPGMLNVADGLAVYAAKLGRLHQSTTSGLSLKVSSWRRIDDVMIPARGKISGAYVNSSLAKDEAVRDGYDDAILLNQDGSVAEVSTCNIFIVRDGVVVTPPVSDNILEGITRQSIMQLCRDNNLSVVERSVDRSELAIADEVLVCGTAVELDWVRQVDQYVIGGGQPGTVYQQLQPKFEAIVRGQVAEYKTWTTKVDKL